MSEEGTRGALTKNRNRLFAVAALLVAAVAFAVITFSGIGENLVYYWNPTGARKSRGQSPQASSRSPTKEASIAHLFVS